jgi:hypothetical protein
MLAKMAERPHGRRPGRDATRCIEAGGAQVNAAPPLHDAVNRSAAALLPRYGGAVIRWLLIAVVPLLAAVAPAAGAPKAELWERWSAHDPDSTETVDHAPWSALLAARLKRAEAGPNRFDYAGVADIEKAALAAYLERLAAVAVSRLARAEQRAYWINLYNALTVKVVLDRYPVDSIREIRSSLFSAGPWGLQLVAVEGVKLSLDDIEHRILRPIWRDPRTHYAVNCASVGCPSLQPEAYTAANMEALLERGAREYVNDPRGVEIVDGRLVVSSIYVWFKEDFGGDDAGVVAHLARYAAIELRARLQQVRRIDSHRYDWSLNGVE